MNGMRKLTMILACDVAGHSRLAIADEEGTVARRAATLLPRQ
jgi:hypothetical protein